MGLSLLVTGAGGFLGQAVVAEGLSRGHAVHALLRRPVPLAEGAVARLQDLGETAPDLTGIDAVIHCAGSLVGDADTQRRDTVAPTETLVRAIAARRTPPRLVLASSLAVYDYAAIPPHAALTEQTALVSPNAPRDAYSHAKRTQEALTDRLSDCWRMRIGLIYGQGRNWNAHIGIGLGPLLVRVGTTGELPLIHVSDCAAAMIRAAETPATGDNALNITGDDRPDRSRFVAAHRAGGWPRISVPLPWPAWLALGRLLTPVPGLPGLLRPAILKSRMMPLRYPNDAARTALDWTPRIPFDAGMAAALEVAR